MPRRRRFGAAGLVFHVLNRSSRRTTLFAKADDYSAFERILSEALARIPTRLLCYCIMPNHWHLVIWPRGDTELSRFMHWLTTTHARRWQNLRQTQGYGPVYQDRFKAIPVQGDAHLIRLCRYVERNALRAGLVDRAEDWRWGSLWQRVRNGHSVPLSAWPIPPPPEWARIVNEPLAFAELTAIRACMKAGSPFGDATWRADTAHALSLPENPRPRGRPSKKKKGTGVFFEAP
jgi:putative transposase